MLGLHVGSVVPADTLVELLWGEDPPRTAAKALQTHISSLRRALGDSLVLTLGGGWVLSESDVDASRYKTVARLGRDAAAAGDTRAALACFEEALALWRGIPDLPDGRRGISEKTRWIESHAALVEDRADALLATGRAAEVVGDLEAAVADAPLRERRWGQLMLALYRAGRQGEALGAYQRARSLLADELGVDPGPELRRLEAAIVAQDASLDVAVAQHLASVTRAVTFLLTDIEGSTAAWEADAAAMAVALARHDELVEQVATSRGGRLIKTRGEGDATFSVFERPSAAAAAAIELQDAITHEPWALCDPLRIRIALHTGEVELRDGDYFGRAVNRVARLRSLAEGGQILCSGATAELVIDSLTDDVMLTDLGMRQLRNLARPEHVFELRLETTEDRPESPTIEAPMRRPSLPAILVGPGPFVGRGGELDRLLSAWRTALGGGMRTVLIAGEPGVGKTRLAGEWSQRAYEQGAVVLYGRCDEDLGAPYQPFAEALRSLVPCMGADRLRAMRGVEALLPLVPGLTDVMPDLASPAHGDPDTERYALFDAVVALLEIASKSAPVLLILDDLHWAAKPTLLLLRHLLRFGDHARVQIVGTYRSTDLDRSHPLAAMLADLHRDGTAHRLNLSGLDEDDVTTYVAEAGYDDEELAHALASVTGGNPFFLIEALRHVDESGGVWDQSTLPQGVREAVSRRLSRLPVETNKALAAAAVVGSRFALELVERVVGNDLVDAFDEACQAGIVIEEPGGNYRFNHAIVRQSLLAELASVRRMRLHQRIATILETLPGADDELVAELARHYFECAWAGNALKAVFYCRRAGDQAMARLAYEGAADLYHDALHALEELDDELPDRDDQTAELLIARCEALLAAGDVASAAGAVSQLQAATVDSARLAAWATCFDGQLSMLIHPERLDEVEAALGEAAARLAQQDDAAGEATAHTVRAGCLARLGRIADCEVALDDALNAARRAREHRRVNAVLAGAPLAALWGPNPVPRAGGRCLDVVRLLRITTDSPAVEATSTRCQAVLEAFRGRAAAARRMIDSARRTITELGLRHALLEVEHFAGIVELVADDPAAAEPYLRKAYNGFRRMGLDADTAETAALLGRVCLALDRDAEADELCSESERLAGHALKASIAWRALRAQLFSRVGNHDAARAVAEEAVALAERTDLLVDHGDACLTLATVLGAAGEVAAARAAAAQAADLYERKGAAALAEKARPILGTKQTSVPAPSEAPEVELDNACVQVVREVDAAVDRQAWDEVEQQFATEVLLESRRRIVGFPRVLLSPSQWVGEAARSAIEIGGVRHRHTVVAVRGGRLALTRLEMRTADTSPGAPSDEMLQLYGIDHEGRIALHIWFDLEDIDAATAELDATHARFEKEEHPRTRRLENGATRAYERLHACFAVRDWHAIAAHLTDDYYGDDRRSVVGAGIRRGPDAAIEDFRSAADIEVTDATSDAIATRGARLALARARYSRSGEEPETFHVDFLQIVEIDTDERISALAAFDLDDVDAAMAELDARYLAGEAAADARTWSAVAGSYAALNRRELPLTTPDCVNVDHRQETAFGPGDVTAYIQTGWDAGQDTNVYVEVVHRLNSRGAVVTYAAHETSREGFDAEWRGIAVFTVHDEKVNRTEVFDETDINAALARFDQLGPPTPRLENAASQATDRYIAHFAARDWDALAKVMAEDIVTDDRRRVVNAGIRQGRDAEIANLRGGVEAGGGYITSVVTATRGERVALARISGHYHEYQAFVTDVLGVVEINSDNQIAAIVVFDLDAFDAAIAELDARYLAGEAAAYSHSWSVVAQTYAAANRQELRLASDCVIIDHRRARAFEPGEFAEYMRATWDIAPNVRGYVEAVHRLSNIGSVFTHVVRGSSQEGFEAEWREVILGTLEGELINRCELFDEADIAAALARFDQLSRPSRQPENAAAVVFEHVWSHFATRDWDAMAETVADNYVGTDHRRVLSAETQHGRYEVIRDLQAAAEVGFTIWMVSAIAIRGERLVLARVRASGRDPDAAQNDALNVVEIDADHRISTVVTYDLEDFEAAIAELDSLYLAGEAAPHARTWSVLTRSYAAVNRHELPGMTPDSVYIDHRAVLTTEREDLAGYLPAVWDLMPDVSAYIEAVHRVSQLGAVINHAARGTSQEGLDAEWRAVVVGIIEGDLYRRVEVFDEADLDAAIARFEELSWPAPRLENKASRVGDQYLAYFAAANWDAMAQMVADNFSNDDRRRVVSAGVRYGREPQTADMRAVANLWTTIATNIMAIRGERLFLTRARFSGRDKGPEAFLTEALFVVEVSADERILAFISFDADDVDAAFEELETRYLAGEAAPCADTWSIVTGVLVAHNRREVAAATSDVVSIDHRRVAAFAPGEGLKYIRAGWELDQELNIYIETVHRLNNLGAVFTWARHGTSHEGFAAEWRGVNLLTVDGEMISRAEVFDEVDIDAAIARFDQLSQPARRPQNAASRVYDRVNACFAARDWDAMANALAENMLNDDRRHIVNSGILGGRDVEIANGRAFAEIGVETITSTVIAIRGGRLALCRTAVLGQGQQSEAFHIELLGVVEIDAEERLAVHVAFDLDDIDAAFEELDARYLAGEAARYASVWERALDIVRELNRHEPGPMIEQLAYTDHRRVAFADGDFRQAIEELWRLVPDARYRAKAVHALDAHGVVASLVIEGTDARGNELHWARAFFLNHDEPRLEIYEESDVGPALERFGELRPRPRLQNAASRVHDRYFAYFRARNWAAIAEILTDGSFVDDRRRVTSFGLWDGHDVVLANLRALADAAPATWAVIATRGERLALTRICSPNRDVRQGEFSSNMLIIAEIDSDERIAAQLAFDVDSIDAAFAELEARYAAGEAAAYAHTWSVIAGAYVSFNQHTVPATTPDSVAIEHRPLVRTDAVDLAESIRAVWDLTPEARIHIEAVHRLSELGAVVTYALKGTSPEGFSAEWRMINIFTAEGDLISRCETFDEEDLDGALARFDELSPPMPLPDIADG